MRKAKIRLTAVGFALAGCVIAHADDAVSTGAAAQQKQEHSRARPKNVFSDGNYHEQGTSRGDINAQSHVDDVNFYAGLGRQGDAPLAEVYTPPPPPKPTCRYREVMSDEELELCKSAARGSQ